MLGGLGPERGCTGALGKREDMALPERKQRWERGVTGEEPLVVCGVQAFWTFAWGHEASRGGDMRVAEFAR